MKNSRALLLASFYLLIAGCATSEVKRRYFWPPLPDTPRVEFVAAYWSADDFPKSTRSTFLESMTGDVSEVRFDKPWGIASDGDGKIYVVDTNLGVVVVFDLKNNYANIFGRGNFVAPAGAALDAEGNIYVSDPRKNKILSFTKDENPRISIGNNTTLNWPVGMAVNNALHRLYVVNGKGHNISVFDLEGNYLFAVGRRGSGDGEFNYPTDVDIDSKGNLVIADSMNARVQILGPDGKFIRKFGRRGDRPEEFQVIKGIAVSRDDHIYVVDGRADRILVFDNEGKPLTSIGATASTDETGKLTPGGFMIPQDVDIDKNDTVYVVDSINKRFQIFQIINEEWLRKYPVDSAVK